jgi:molecular chaperone GrpE (heat shock protein)
MMPETEITLPDDFACTMQQLVAEAEKTISPGLDDDGVQGDGLVTLNARVAALEQAISAGFQKLAVALPESNSPWQWERVDENLRALRNTESVNQRLFNSLHEELKAYRDNFLRESLQKPFIRDLVLLFDDLNGLAEHMRSAGAASKGRQGKLTQWSANLDNAIHGVVEIMHRLEVNEIEPRETVDRTLHKVMSYEKAQVAEEDGQIVKRLKRGFVWREQVLRPEEVVAKRFG